MKKIEPKTSWDPETGVATCYVYDPDIKKWLAGVARCAPIDRDMISEKTGLEIASYRAFIKLYKSKRFRLREEYKHYKNIYNIYESHPKFNKEDPFVRIVRKKMYSTLDDIECYNNLIKDTEEYLKVYINGKDKIYQRLRINRIN